MIQGTEGLLAVPSRRAARRKCPSLSPVPHPTFDFRSRYVVRSVFALSLVLLVGCTGSTSSNPSASPNGSTGATGPGVFMLRYNAGSESTEQREQGFLDVLAKEYPDVKVLSSDQYAGTTPESSLEKSQQMLLKHRGQVAGVFSVCEPNAAGMLGALDESGEVSKIKFVGFDPSPHMVDALREGKMNGIVLQDPVQMGYLSVKAMIDHLEGRPVEKRIPTGEYVATRENMDTPEMKKLLNPEQFQDSGSPVESPKYRLAVIPKGTTHEFWKAVHAGAEKAAKEIGGIEIIWKGPILESDREGQINVVQDFITAKVSGIILAPLDSQALVQSVKDAKAANIPTVIFDSGLADESVIVSYVATDNYRGGELAGHCLAEALGAKPKTADASHEAAAK